MLSALVLAAGASRRMGSPKALLRIGETTFLQHIVGTLRAAHINDIVLVLGASEERIRENLAWFDGTIAVNRNWHEGQLSSIIAGLDALQPGHSRGVMICPVDHPLMTKDLLKALVHAFETSDKKIILPTHKGRRGHPVIFDATLFDELRRAPREVGARAVVRNHPDDLEEVPTPERGVGVDIDTMQDYEKEILHRSYRHSP